MEKNQQSYKIKPFQSLSLKIFMGIIIFIIVPVFMGFIYTYKLFENIITEEISKSNIKNITQFKEDINITFDNMVKTSNYITNNSFFTSVLDNENSDYYERSQVITKVFSDVLLNSNFSDENIRLTFIDDKGHIYSNWSLNYNDYGFILEKDWVKEALDSNYYAVWSDFENSFIKEERNVKYVSLARNVQSKQYNNIGTLIVSVSENEFIKTFKKYMPEKDSSLLISSPNGKIITYFDNDGLSKSKEIMNFILENKEQNMGYKLLDINNKKYLVNSYNIKKSEWTSLSKEWRITIVSSYENIISQLKVYSSKITVIIIVATVILLFAAAYVTAIIFYPIKKLEKGMYDFNLESNLDFLNLKRKDEIGFLNRAFYNMAQSIKELFDKLETEHKTIEKYRYESLRAQLNPHFLFNTLNTIRWMAIIRKADNIVQTIDALSNMLKYSMNRGGELIPVKSELENIKSYIFIQNNRYGSSYEVKYDIDENLMELKIIKFILQPIVENSIIHAFEDRDGVGFIKIEGRIENDNLIISVEDNGIGMTEDEIKKIFQVKNENTSSDMKVTGLGIRTIDEMLKIACGHQYGLQVQSSKNGTKTTLKLPIIGEKEKANV